MTPAGNRPGNAPSGDPAVSSDGRFVAFQSNAINLVPGPPGSYQVRVIGLAATGQVFGSFSNAITLIVQ